MEEKITKVPCSFCGKIIGCPEDMLNAEKHMCYNCFQNEEIINKESANIKNFHVDLPLEESRNMIVNSLFNNAFPEIWKDSKSDIKEMSKREIAETMFKVGADMMLGYMKEMDKELAEIEQDNTTKHKNT